MNKFVTCAVIALVSGCLWAQTQQGQPRIPKTTTWKGTLVDTGCRSSQSERNKTSGVASSYPARIPTTAYGLMTASGECIPLDVGSNEKVQGLLKISTDWSENEAKIKPTSVEVVGTKQDGKIAVDEIRFR